MSIVLVTLLIAFVPVSSAASSSIEPVLQVANASRRSVTPTLSETPIPPPVPADAPEVIELAKKIADHQSRVRDEEESLKQRSNLVSILRRPRSREFQSLQNATRAAAALCRRHKASIEGAFLLRQVIDGLVRRLNSSDALLYFVPEALERSSALRDAPDGMTLGPIRLSFAPGGGLPFLGVLPPLALPTSIGYPWRRFSSSPAATPGGPSTPSSSIPLLNTVGDAPRLIAPSTAPFPPLPPGAPANTSTAPTADSTAPPAAPVPAVPRAAPPQAFIESAERKRMLRMTDLVLKERILQRIEKHAAAAIGEFERSVEAAQGSVVSLDAVALATKVADSAAEYALNLRSDGEDAKIVQGGDVDVVQQAEAEERRVVSGHKSNLVEKVLEDVGRDVDRVEAKSENTRQSVKARISTPTKGGVYQTFLLVGSTAESVGGDGVPLESLQALDPSGNVFTLAHAADSTVRHVDPRMVFDLLLCFFVAGCGAVIAHVCRVPVGHGMIFSGLLLTSSSGPDAVVNLVTIESLAQIAVYVLLYAMGSEFEPQQLARVRHVAMVGMPILLVTLISFFAAAVMMVMGASLNTGVMIGMALCISSTQIAHRIRTTSALPQANTLVVGMLAVEDTLLGCLSGVVPLLAAGGAFSEFVTDFSALLFRFCVFLTVGAILTVTVLPRCLRVITQVDNGTATVALVAFLVAMLTLCEAVGAPGEVACFSAGLMLAFAAKGEYRHFCAARITTALDLLMPFFYLTIGIRLFPQFLAAQAVVLLLLSAFVLVSKFVITYVLFRVFRVDHPTAAVAAVTLSPLAEFSYVLVTLGRSHGLIQREVYFIAVGVITITLLVVPFLHPFVERAVTWRGGGVVSTYAEAPTTTDEDEL